MNPLFCKILFENVPTEDLIFLDMQAETGMKRRRKNIRRNKFVKNSFSLGRPEDMIFTQVPVPPCCIRPSVAAGDQTNQDDLTMVIKV